MISYTPLLTILLAFSFVPLGLLPTADSPPVVDAEARGQSLSLTVNVVSSLKQPRSASAPQPKVGEDSSSGPVATSSNLTVLSDANNKFAGFRVESEGFELSRGVCPGDGMLFTIKRFTPNLSAKPDTAATAARTCETPTAATQITAATPPITVTQTMFQSLPLKQRRTECNCGQGKEQLPYGTVTVPIVFWQDNTPETVTTTMLGQVIEVQATPIHWSMNFGDNTPPWNSKTPGVPYNDNYKIIHPDTIPGTIWHAWEHRGRYPITQTITYTGQFRVNGGPWQPIPGNATKPGPSTTVIINSYVALEVAPDYYPDN